MQSQKKHEGLADSEPVGDVWYKVDMPATSSNRYWYQIPVGCSTFGNAPRELENAEDLEFG